MGDRPNMMGTMPMGKLIAKMSIPLMISMLIQALYNIVDSIFVSRLGIAAISAIGIAFPIQMLMIASANGIGVGMNALIAQRFGRGEGDRVGRVAGNALLLATIVTLVFMVFGVFGTEAYLQGSNEDAAIITYGVEYLRVVCLGCCGVFYAILLERLLQVTGKATLSMITQLVGAIVNIILDPVLIFGYLGAPAMGMTGAAVATVIGQVFSVALGLWFHFRLNRAIQVKAADIRLDKDALRVCRVGVPVALTMSMGSVMTFSVNMMLAPFVEALAVFTVYFKLQSFIFMPIAGLMQGLTPIIGFNYGAGNGQRLKEAIRIAIKATLVFMVVGLLLCQVFPAALIGLFDGGKNAAMVPMGIRALRIISCIFPVVGVAWVFSNVFQGMGTGFPGLIFGLSRQCIILLPAFYLLLNFFGVSAVWYAFWISDFVTAVLTFFIYRVEYKKRVVPVLEEEQRRLAAGATDA